MAADPAVGRADAGVALAASPAVRAAAEDLYALHGARVLAYCRRRLGSQEEAEDALQTTFLYACRGLQRGVVPEIEIAWLLKIAHNVCLSHWDSNRRRRRLELVQDPAVLDGVTPAVAPDRENALALETALADLTDLQRRAILLREWRGLSYQEIAGELALSSSAVETLIFRARRALARSLDRQDVGRARTRLARCLDFGGLLPALKSALGAAGGTKVAAGLAVGAALVAGSIPDVPTRPAEERPAAAVAPQPSRASQSPLPLAADPVAEPSMRAAAGLQNVEKPAAAKKKPRAERRSQERGRPAEGEPGSPTGQAPALGEVTSGVGAAVGGVTDTVNGVVETVTGVVEETVDSLPEVLPPVLDVIPPVLGVVPPVLGVVDGVLGGQGALQP